MESKRANYIHGILLDYGAYLREGMTCQGIFGTSNWPEGKPQAHHAPTRRTKKPLVPQTQPQETRSSGSRIPRINIDYTSERIHPVIIAMPDGLKLVVCYLYIRGLCFADTAHALNMTSKQINKSRYKVLKVIDTVI